MPTLRTLANNNGLATWSDGVPTTQGAIAAATVLTLDDSDGIFTVSQAAGYAITLPTPTGPGIRYMFQIGTTGGNSVTVRPTAGAGVSYEGTIINDITSVIAIVANDTTLTFVAATAVLGDTIEVISTSTTKWFVRAVTSAAGGITRAA